MILFAMKIVMEEFKGGNIMRVEKQSTVWQPNSMGCFDGLKLKFNNFVIDQTLNYLGKHYSKQKLINLAKILDRKSVV